MKKERRINEKGITMIALVVTIIVIIILAGISLNLFVSENSIMARARKQKEEQEVLQITERLELKKAPVAVDNDNRVKLDDYLDYIYGEGKIENELSEPDREDEKNAYITVDGKYEYLLQQEKNNNLLIIYLGKVGELKPRIVDFEVTNTTNSINVKVAAKRVEKYSYYIKDDINKDYDKYPIASNKTGEYTFKDLTSEKIYYIKIIAENENGTDEIEINRTTGEVIISQGNIEFTLEPSTWTNKNVVATAKATIDITGYSIQTSKDGKTWDNTATQTFSANGTIYARIADSTNQASGAASRDIDNIDVTAPTVTANLIDKTTNTITVSATSEDNESGMPNTIIYKYYIKKNGESYPTQANYTGADASYKFTGLLQTTTYDIKVETQDSVGNVGTAIITNVQTGTVTASQGNITFEISPSGWTNGSVTATAKTTVTGFTIKTSTNGTTWEAKASQTFTANGTIYAKLVDSTDQTSGSAASRDIDNIDLTKPVVTGATGTTNSVTITATDEASGIIGYAVTEANTVPSSFTSCTNTKSLNVTVSNIMPKTTYYAWVKDEAGNVSVSKSFTTGDIAIGSYITYVVPSKSYTMTAAQTGYSSNQTFNTSSYTGSWRVLYNDATNGLQIISDDVVAELAIQGKVGYNNLVSTLNTMSANYNNTTYASSIRSVGTTPSNTADTTTKYTNSSYSFIASYANDMLVGDENAATDYAQLAQYGMSNIGKYYWLASRYVYIDANGAGFHGGMIDGSGEKMNYDLMCVHPTGHICNNTFTAGVRPVIKLKSIKVTGGAGTKASPYTITVQ